MNFISFTKKAVLTSACIALCVVLPMAFHAIPNAGNIWLPMHIPVLLCGLICGWKFGLLCGILGPLVSSLITQMPVFAYLPSMMIELSAYGLFSGLLMGHVHTGKLIRDVLISLIAAMIIGRVFYGAANALIFNTGKYSLNAWLTAGFITAIPGIILQLVLIPSIIVSLEKASLIPERY